MQGNLDAWREISALIDELTGKVDEIVTVSSVPLNPRERRVAPCA
jgi:hypothetical protein